MVAALCVLAIGTGVTSCSSTVESGSTGTDISSASAAPNDAGQPADAPSSSAATGATDDTVTDGAPSGSSGGAQRMTTEPVPNSSTQSPTPPAGPLLPGGTAGTTALESAGLLTDGGRLSLGGIASSGTERIAGSQALTSALCSFVFGAPADVATIARLPGDLVLAASSGARRDTGLPGSITLTCVFQSGGTPLLVLQVGDGPPVDPDLPGRPIIVGIGGIQAVLSYSPANARPMIDSRLARDWLSAAINRVATSTG